MNKLATRHKNIKELAEQVEIWLAPLRYANNALDQKISLKDIVTLSEISTGDKIYLNAVNKIQTIVDYYQILHPVPEEIKNRLLCLLAFYKPEFEFGPAPKIE